VALMSSMEKLRAAATSAAELLLQAGFAGMRGDTADDLRVAIVVHEHLLQEFNIKVRTNTGTLEFQTQARDAVSAATAALAQAGDSPCGVTITPANPDRASLAAAHRALKVAAPLDDALKDPSLRTALHSYARKHPARRPTTTDFKSLAANDRD